MGFDQRALAGDFSLASLRFASVRTGVQGGKVICPTLHSQLTAKTPESHCGLGRHGVLSLQGQLSYLQESSEGWSDSPKITQMASF